VSGQLKERRAGGTEFQIFGDATEKLRAANPVRANGTMSRLVLEVGDDYGLGPKPQQVRGRAPRGEFQRRSHPKPEYFCIPDKK